MNDLAEAGYESPPEGCYHRDFWVTVDDLPDGIDFRMLRVAKCYGCGEIFFFKVKAADGDQERLITITKTYIGVPAHFEFEAVPIDGSSTSYKPATVVRKLREMEAIAVQKRTTRGDLAKKARLEEAAGAETKDV